MVLKRSHQTYPLTHQRILNLTLMPPAKSRIEKKQYLICEGQRVAWKYFQRQVTSGLKQVLQPHDFLPYEHDKDLMIHYKDTIHYQERVSFKDPYDTTMENIMARDLLNPNQVAEITHPEKETDDLQKR